MSTCVTSISYPLLCSEKNNQVTGEVDSSPENVAEESRQPTLQEGGQQVPSMADVTRHNCMGTWKAAMRLQDHVIPWGVKLVYVHVGCLEP